MGVYYHGKICTIISPGTDERMSIAPGVRPYPNLPPDVGRDNPAVWEFYDKKTALLI